MHEAKAPVATRVRRVLRTEWQELTRINASDRLWQMAAAAALSMTMPLVVAAWTGHMRLGLVGSLAGLVFLYIQHTPLYHRMVAMMACAFGMTACYSAGLLCHLMPALILPAVTIMAVLVMMVCRFYVFQPPGGLFFIMAASIGAYSPVKPPDIFATIGVFALGAMFACLVAFLYSLSTLRLREPVPPQPPPAPSFDFVIVDGLVIGGAVGLSLLLAQLLSLQRPYWVPVSCLAVIQATSLRAVWNRQLQRILGTGAGLLLAWGLFSLPLGPWHMVVAIMILSFVTEMLVVRHYAVATMFITPLTIMLAEAAQLGQASPGALMQARLIDTVVGCLVGLVGGICLHNPRFRRALTRT